MRICGRSFSGVRVADAPVRRVTPEELTKFLDWVRKGEQLHKAARRIGVTYAAVRAAREAYPEFDAAVREAEEEAAEPVESVLYAAALRGEPWAVTKWLEARSKDRWKSEASVRHTVDVNVEVGPRLARITELRAELERRRAAVSGGVGPVLDVVSEEVDPPPSLPAPPPAPA